MLSEFVEGGFALRAVNCFDRVGDQGDAAMAVEQAFRGEADAKFGDYAEDKEFAILGKLREQLLGRGIVEYIEGLFSEHDLLRIEEIAWDVCARRVFDMNGAR